MIADKHGNHVRTFMWQPCGWGRVDNCMTFHMRAFDFVYHLVYHCTRHIDLKIFKIARL
jgi:hypothetical protein